MSRNTGFKAVCFSILLLTGIHNGYGVDRITSTLINETIKKHQNEIIKIRRFLHMNPELGNREHETARLLASKLLFLGLDIKTNIAKTGVVALLEGSGPGITIAVRADIDALPIQEMTDLPYKSLNPGVMHACGHDIHSAIVLGTAYVLNALKARINGNIKFIFQPAEEGAPQGEEGGAELMIREGVLEDPPVRAIFGLHVWPEDLGNVYFASGPLLAGSNRFRVMIKGKSAHGARPHEGIDAISLASQIIVSLQNIISRTVDPTDPAVLTIGKIEGGSRANIIADQVWFEGTLRTLSPDNRKKIPALMEDIIRGLCSAFGADYTFQFNKGTPVLYNHPQLADILNPSLINAAGKSKVKATPPQMVAEDFAFYSQKIPGFFFLLGSNPPRPSAPPPLHSPYFNPDERSISLGIRIMCHLLLDCLEHQRQIKDSFQ